MNPLNIKIPVLIPQSIFIYLFGYNLLFSYVNFQQRNNPHQKAKKFMRTVFMHMTAALPVKRTKK